MAGVWRFEDLRVWREAKALSEDTAPILARSSLSSEPKLRDQLGAAVASVMANIAEGFVRRRRKEFTQFVRIAAASNAEARSLLYVLTDRGHLTVTERNALLARTESITRMLRRLLDYLDVAPGPHASRAKQEPHGRRNRNHEP